MTYDDGRPREALRPAPCRGLERVPAAWVRRARLAGIVAGIVASEWVSIALAHALGV
jgi:hypothetical protein